MKRFLSLAVAVAMAVTMGLSFDSASAASRPAKVKGVKAASTNYEITLKWKKAKRAKKYQVYQYNKAKKKYVKVRTTKKRTVVINKLKPDTKYKFKIRAVRGKKKGKWSKVKKVKTRTPVTHTKTVDPIKTKFIVGDTYTIKKGNNSNETVTITITEVLNDDNYVSISGKTKNGGTFGAFYEKAGSYIFDLEEPDYEKHFTYKDDGDITVITGISKILKIKDDNTICYWTLDGTEPKKGQTDLTGYSKWCRIEEDISEFSYRKQIILLNDYKLKRGDELDPNGGFNKKLWYPLTKLRGTAKKGTSYMWTEPHDTSYEYEHIKVFNNNKLIFEKVLCFK